MGSGRIGYFLACSKEEIELLLGLVVNCRENFPLTFELSPTRNRLNNIIKELSNVNRHIDDQIKH